MIEIHLVLFFMIAAAVIAVEAKDLLSSVIAVGAVGIGLSMGFLVLKAPDLAMMQLVVEILSLIILIRATIRKDVPFSVSGRWVFNTVSTVIFLLMFLGLAYSALWQMPQFGQPIMRLAETFFKEGPVATGARNVVAAISLNFRALDTMGETVALFAAIVGILVIARKKARE